MKNRKLWIKFWWPVILFAVLLLVSISMIPCMVDSDSRNFSLLCCMAILCLCATVGMLTHRLSLIGDVKSGRVVCHGDEDVELDNVLRCIYYEYLTGRKYEVE